MIETHGYLLLDFGVTDHFISIHVFGVAPQLSCVGSDGERDS